MNYVAVGGPIDGEVVAVSHKEMGDWDRYVHAKQERRCFSEHEYRSLEIDGVRSLIYVGAHKSTNLVPDNLVPGLMSLLGRPIVA